MSVGENDYSSVVFVLSKTIKKMMIMRTLVVVIAILRLAIFTEQPWFPH